MHMNIRNKLMQTCFFQALLPVFYGLFVVCSRVVLAFCFFPSNYYETE